MKTVHNITLLGISLLLLTGLAACDKPGPAETAGTKLDAAADSAGMKIEETYDKAGEKLGEKSDQFGVVMHDAEITAKVKSAIYSEPGLKTLRISVDTVEGVVTLTGSVGSQSDFDRSSTLANTVGGVRKVDNLLQIKPAH